MNVISRFVAALTAVLFMLGALNAQAQDWPQWRGPQRDGKVQGFTAPQTWPKTLAQQWKVTVGLGDASPVLVGDKLYVFGRQGEDEVLLCLNSADGKELWRDKNAAPKVTGAQSRHPGTRATPTVVEGKVITFGVGGLLSCLDAATGKPVWRNDAWTTTGFFTAMSPLVTDGLCVAHVGAGGKSAVVALDLTTGKPKWQWTGDSPAQASPVTLTADGVRQIVMLTNTNAIGLGAADGKLLWSVPFPVKGSAFNAATPIVDGQTVIITGQGRGTKALKIEKKDAGFDARELWLNPKLASRFCTPMLKDGLLYGVSDTGYLFCASASDGQVAWTDTNKVGNFGALLDAGAVLLAWPNTGELIAFKPGAKQFEALSRLKVAETETYACPVVSGKRIFVKDKDAVALFTIG